MAFGLSFAGGFAKREMERNDKDEEARLKEEAAVLASERALKNIMTADKARQELASKLKIKELETATATNLASLYKANGLNPGEDNSLSLNDSFSKLDAPGPNATETKVDGPKADGPKADGPNTTGTKVISPVQASPPPVDYITQTLGPEPTTKLTQKEILSLVADANGSRTAAAKTLSAKKLALRTQYITRKAALSESISQFQRVGIEEKDYIGFLNTDTYEVSKTGGQHIFVRQMLNDYAYDEGSALSMQKDLITRLNGNESEKDIQKYYRETRSQFEGFTPSGEYDYISESFNSLKNFTLKDASEVVKNDKSITALTDEMVSLLAPTNIINPRSEASQTTNALTGLATAVLQGSPGQSTGRYGAGDIEKEYSSIQRSVLTPFIDASRFNTQNQRGARDLMGSADALQVELTEMKNLYKNAKPGDDMFVELASLEKQATTALFHRQEILNTAEYAARSNQGWEGWKTAIKNFGGTQKDIDSAIIKVRKNTMDLATGPGGMDAAKEYIDLFNDNRPFQEDVVDSIMVTKETIALDKKFTEDFPEGIPSPRNKPVPPVDTSVNTSAEVDTDNKGAVQDIIQSGPFEGVAKETLNKATMESFKMSGDDFMTEIDPGSSNNTGWDKMLWTAQVRNKIKDLGYEKTVNDNNNRIGMKRIERNLSRISDAPDFEQAANEILGGEYASLKEYISDPSIDYKIKEDVVDKIKDRVGYKESREGYISKVADKELEMYIKKATDEQIEEAAFKVAAMSKEELLKTLQSGSLSTDEDLELTFAFTRALNKAMNPPDKTMEVASLGK